MLNLSVSHLCIVLRGEVCHVLDEGELQVSVDGGDEAPVEDAEPPVGSAEQVARVRVAV